MTPSRRAPARSARRALLGFGTAMMGAEALSLFGCFDHRVARLPSARAGVARALATEDDRIVHVGHSTHVIRLDGRLIVTDPWFSDPAFGALRHTTAPACAIEDLAQAHAVLVSHEHPDHADFAALDRLPSKSRTSVLVATSALERRIRGLGFATVHVLAPWDGFPLGPVTVHAVPGVHDVPELGFVVAGSRSRVYFAGDTAFTSDFFAVRERFSPSFAILPVDGLRLRGSGPGTMGAGEAVEAVRALAVARVMPSHGEAEFTDPLAEHVLTSSAPGGAALFRRMLRKALPKVECFVPEVGTSVLL